MLPTPATFLPVTLHLIESEAFHPAPIEANLPNGVRLRILTVNVQLAYRHVRAITRAKTDSGGSK